MFGFNPALETVKIGEEPSFKNWVLEMPSAGEKPVTLPQQEMKVAPPPPACVKPIAAKLAETKPTEPPKTVAAAKPAEAKPAVNATPRNRRPATQQRPGVQNATVRATGNGE